MRKLLLFGTIIVLLAACTRREKSGTNHYVDVPAFFKKQATLYNTYKGHKLKKTLTIDGVSETKELLCDTFQLLKELSVFADIDINKTAYKGIFAIDTLRTDTSYTVRYINGVDKHLPLKELNAHYTNSNVLFAVHINAAHTNMLSSNIQKLHLYNRPDKTGYGIYIKDMLKTGSETITVVDAEVVK